MKCLTENAIAKLFHSQHVSQLHRTKFSVLIDEATDIATKKQLCVVVRYYCNQAMKVKSAFYILNDASHATAESLFGVLTAALEAAGIAAENIIGFSADGANVMHGEHNSVASRLKEQIPGIFVLKCMCHSAHLCASHACETLPRSIEDISRDIYAYFSHSAKRISQFEQFQHFAEVEPHKLLWPCQTRWLSLHVCGENTGIVGCSCNALHWCLPNRSPSTNATSSSLRSSIFVQGSP